MTTIAQRDVKPENEREAKGGDSTAGTWDRDVAARVEGGTKP